MIAGVPGAGISAFFYLLCVLLMPFHAAWRMARGDNPRWSLVARQLGIGVGIVVGLITGGAVVAAIAASGGELATQPGQLGQAALDIGLTLGRIGVFLGIATLVLVMGSVQLFSVIDRRRAVPAAQAIVARPTETHRQAGRAHPWSTGLVTAHLEHERPSTNGHGPARLTRRSARADPG